MTKKQQDTKKKQEKERKRHARLYFLFKKLDKKIFLFLVFDVADVYDVYDDLSIDCLIGKFIITLITVNVTL